MSLAALALLLFSLTLAGGLGVAVYAARRHRAPLVGYVHGALALSGVAVLFERIAHGPANLGMNSALFLFVIAVAGGLLVALFKIRREPPPLAFIIIHASVGCAAFVVFALAFSHA